MKEKVKIQAMVLIALLLITTAQGEIIYVEDDANGANDGSSWVDAYNDLLDALAVAQYGDEIRVAQGVYKPTKYGFPPPAGPPPVDRTSTFQLINGVTLKGGYAGYGEADPNLRDIEANETVLSGDHNGDDVVVNDPMYLLDEPTRGENSYHVVTASGTDGTAVLDGFTITAGNANESVYPNNHRKGGGIFNEGGSPKVTNCTFRNNSAMYYGGGMYNGEDNINPVVTNCTFVSNWASSGGAVYNAWKSKPTLTNCAFIVNIADYSGGGMYNDYSSPILTNCTFTANSANRGNGGGMLVYCAGRSAGSSRPTLTNCLFRGNSASKGGAISCIGQLPPPFPGTPPAPWRGPIITNCTISQNSAIAGAGIYNSYIVPILSNCTLSGNSAGESGGGIHNTYHANIMVTNCTFSGNSAKYDGGGMANHSSNPTLTNCILWNNTAPTDPQISGNGTVLYSDVEGGWPGEGNIDADPLFVQPGYRVPPPFASEPNPADGAMGVSLDADLSWRAGYDAVSHDVYFGTSYPPLFIINQTSTTFDPGTLAYSTMYYWHINEVSDSGVTTGDIWSFTTIMAPPPPPPPGTPLSISTASSMSDNQQYTWVEGDYHLLPDSPCIDTGDPCYVAEPNETDLDGNPRVLDGNGDTIAVVDMGAYESIPPIPAEIRFNPSAINVEGKGEWITCYIRLPDGFNVADIDTNSILLEYAIEPEEFWINESKQTAMVRFRHEEVRVILEIGEIELSIIGWLTDKTVFVGTDVIKVTDKGGRGPNKNLQASVPNITDVSISANLSWTAGSYATSHDVYFGTSNPPPFVRNQKAATFYPGTMDYETRYYWRIDEINKWGVTSGEIWSFVTIEAPPPPPPPGPKPPSAPPGCFPADTPVWIDGEQVQFSKVTAGQKVGRLDETNAVSSFEKPEPLKEIESVLEYQGTDDYYNIVLENGNRINVVHSHYFLTASDQWVRVENLKAGSKLQSLNGPIPIKTISKSEVPFTGRFYNLKIKGGDRYFVGKDGVTVRGH